MDINEQFFRASMAEAMRWAREDERKRIIRLLEEIEPGSGILGDDVELAISLIKGEKNGQDF